MTTPVNGTNGDGKLRHAIAKRMAGKKFAGSVVATIALCLLTLAPAFNSAITVQLAETALKALVAVNLFFFGGQTAVDSIGAYLNSKSGDKQ
jgi:hypothetical protein